MIDKLRKQIQELQDKINLIQDECTHPKSSLTEKYGCNVGNYDSSADSYWIDYHCGLCKKKWTTKQ